MSHRKLTALSIALFLALFSALTGFVACAEPVSMQDSRTVVSILGDSYSTFEGHIPDGNIAWYREHPKADRTDVTDVRQTWWWQLIERGGYTLGVNDSYSGATVGYRGYNGDDYADRSFITRLPRLGSPDIILIFGATNDSWAGVEVGDYNYDNEIPREQLYTFRPAMSRLLAEAKKRYPQADIYFIINSELRDDITESIRQVCSYYGVDYIELHDIAKLTGHPSCAGMDAIATQVLERLKK